MKYTCIYCKQEKEESEFNREHVVPKMMGTYINAPVLHDHQVCQECNSYFSREIEDKIGMNSYEGFLRMRYGRKKMSDNRSIGHARLSIFGNEGIFKGLEFTPVSDAKNPERMHFDAEPRVVLQVGEDEYLYYALEDLPDATPEKIEELRKFKNPIIQVGYEGSDVDKVLREKGYITREATYSEEPVEKLYKEGDFETKIKIKVDSYVRRVCAKTIFNYLCWSTSPEHMLSEKFDSLREYIRYGTLSDDLWFRDSMGYVTAATPPNDTAHVIGTMLYNNKGKWELLGCLTWFGEVTYILKICDIKGTQFFDFGENQKVGVLPRTDTKFMYFNNETGETTIEDAVFIYGGRYE